MSRLSRKNKGDNTKEEPKKQEEKEQKENTTEITTIEPKVVEIIPKEEEKPIEVEPEIEEKPIESQVEDLPELNAGKNVDGSDYIEVVPANVPTAMGVPVDDEIPSLNEEEILAGKVKAVEKPSIDEEIIIATEVEVKVVEKPFEAKLLTVKPIAQRKLDSLSSAELKTYQRTGILPK